MSDPSRWLAKLAKLRIDRAKGVAPHKPLLLLIILEMVETGELATTSLPLTPSLAFRFNQFWGIVAHRRRQRPDVRLPFYRLKSDGLCEPFTSDGTIATDKNATAAIKLPSEFLQLAHLSDFRDQARAILIKTYFEPAEQQALAALVNLELPKIGQLETQVRESLTKQSLTGREIRFRLDIVAAYQYTCALTGYRITTISGASIIDAAHIHQFSDSRNNDPNNGLALCKNAHWMFDQGLWSLDDNYRVIVARDAFDESARDGKALRDYHGASILLPRNEKLWPHQKHLEWHRSKKLKKL